MMSKKPSLARSLQQQIKDHSRKTGIPFHLWIFGTKPADRRVIPRKIKPPSPDLHKDFRDELLS
jgi:hypothetical protein